MTPKQNLLETLKGGNPACLCNSFTMLRGIPGDPCFKLIRGNRIRGTNSIDACLWSENHETRAFVTVEK